MSNKGNYRQDAIMKLLLQKKAVAVDELSKLFSVTPTTIRRDLLELEAIIRYGAPADMRF